MVALSGGMAVPTIIRCSVRDCDWGFETTDSGRMDQCYEAYTDGPDAKYATWTIL